MPVDAPPKLSKDPFEEYTFCKMRMGQSPLTDEEINLVLSFRHPETSTPPSTQLGALMAAESMRYGTALQWALALDKEAASALEESIRWDLAQAKAPVPTAQHEPSR